MAVIDELKYHFIYARISGDHAQTQYPMRYSARPGRIERDLVGHFDVGNGRY